MIARYGLEGGAVYALSAALRASIEADGRADVHIDLKPDVAVGKLTDRLSKPRGKASLSNHLRKVVGLEPVAVALLYEAGPLPVSPRALAERIKAMPLTLTGVQGLERAISSAGGVALDGVDERLMLVATGRFRRRRDAGLGGPDRRLSAPGQLRLGRPGGARPCRLARQPGLRGAGSRARR